VCLSICCLGLLLGSASDAHAAGPSAKTSLHIEVIVVPTLETIPRSAKAVSVADSAVPLTSTITSTRSSVVAVERREMPLETSTVVSQ
jgi:hypothetical protein